MAAKWIPRGKSGLVQCRGMHAVHHEHFVFKQAPGGDGVALLGGAELESGFSKQQQQHCSFDLGITFAVLCFKCSDFQINFSHSTFRCLEIY